MHLKTLMGSKLNDVDIFAVKPWLQDTIIKEGRWTQ